MKNRLLIAGVIALGLATIGQAASLRPLLEQERAAMGATHVASVTYADFAAITDTNTALVITNLIASANMGVELVAMRLVTAFDTANTNFTGSLAVTVGDGSDADLYLASTELASDGTEVRVAYGRQDADTITSTVTKQTVTLTDTNAVTAVVVTNATVASTGTVGVRGRKLYTTATPIFATFTPNAEEALGANTAGRVEFYFRLLGL